MQPFDLIAAVGDANDQVGPSAANSEYFLGAAVGRGRFTVAVLGPRAFTSGEPRRRQLMLPRGTIQRWGWAVLSEMCSKSAS